MLGRCIVPVPEWLAAAFPTLTLEFLLYSVRCTLIHFSSRGLKFRPLRYRSPIAPVRTHVPLIFLSHSKTPTTGLLLRASRFSASWRTLGASSQSSPSHYAAYDVLYQGLALGHESHTITMCKVYLLARPCESILSWPVDSFCISSSYLVTANPSRYCCVAICPLLTPNGIGLSAVSPSINELPIPSSSIPPHAPRPSRCSLHATCAIPVLSAAQPSRPTCCSPAAPALFWLVLENTVTTTNHNHHFRNLQLVSFFFLSFFILFPFPFFTSSLSTPPPHIPVNYGPSAAALWLGPVAKNYAPDPLAHTGAQALRLCPPAENSLYNVALPLVLVSYLTLFLLHCHHS